MITEDYVSFKIAKLLKYKGADFDTDKVYTSMGRAWEINMKRFKKEFGYDDVSNYIQRPTLQMAMKWMREVHDLHITIKPYITVKGVMYLFEIYKFKAEKFTLIKTKTGFEKPELANEASLEYILENLRYDCRRLR